MKKIRVVHVVEAKFAGVERYVHALLKNSDHQKVENYLICPPNYDANQFDACEIFKVDMAHQIDVKSDIKSIRKIREIITNISPDIVYAHSSKAGALGRIACLGLSVKVIYNPHGWAFNMQQSSKKRVVYKIIEKVQSPFTDRIICISEAERISALKNKIASSKKLIVINNGIDMAEIDQNPYFTREELGIPKSAFVIGQVGRLTKQKAPDTFVRAASLIIKKIPNAFFILVGDGDLKQETEQLINKYHLEDHFVMSGWVKNPSSYLKVMDVATLLSRWEGFGLVLPEYMYSGIPLVATKVDAIPYVVKDGQTGLLVNKDDPQAVLEAVLRLHEDEKLRQYLVDQEEKAVKEKFDVRRVADQTLDAYCEVLK